MIQNLFNYIFLLLVFLSIFYSFKKIKAGKEYIKIFNFMFVLLALLVAFRYGTGIDTANYMVAYEYIPPIDEMSIGTFALFRFQPLYTIVNSVCKFIWSDFLLVQIAQVLAFYPALYVLLKYFDLRNFYILLFCIALLISEQECRLCESALLWEWVFGQYIFSLIINMS